MSRRWLQQGGGALLALAVLAGLTWGGRRLWAARTPAPDAAAARAPQPGRGNDRTYTVRRGDFAVVLPQDGTLEAVKVHALRCLISSRLPLVIEEVVADNSPVKAGQAVIRFVGERHREELATMEVKLQDERKNLTLFLEDQQIKQAEIASQLKAAADQLQEARGELRKFEEKEADFRRGDLKNARLKAEAQWQAELDKLARKKNDRDRLLAIDPDKASQAEKEIDLINKTVTDAATAISRARYELKLFKQYTFPSQINTLRAKVNRAGMDLQRQLVNASSETLKIESQIQSQRLKLKELETRIAEMREVLANLEIKAPVAGIVSFGDPNQRWMRRELKPGEEVRKNEYLGTIPDLSGFKVMIQVPEEYRSKIREGSRAALVCRALPQLKMSGTVATIAGMAEGLIRWDPSSPKAYPTEILTEARDPRLMPGMTIAVEITVEVARNVLFAPVEAVYTKDGETYCRVSALTGTAERKVKVGRSSIDYVELLDGVAEGDVVLLHRKEEG